MARPQNLAAYEQPTLAQCAAAYAFGIVRNHPFNDGNKRPGFVIAVTFLLFYIAAPESEVVLIIVQLAEGEMTEEKLADRFEKTIVPFR